jgi:hypothetical protein
MTKDELQIILGELVQKSWECGYAEGKIPTYLANRPTVIQRGANFLCQETHTLRDALIQNLTDSGYCLCQDDIGHEGGTCTYVYGKRPCEVSGPPDDAWELTDEEIDTIGESMPGGMDGFLKGWGWRNFARAIEAEIMLKLQPERLSAEQHQALNARVPPDLVELQFSDTDWLHELRRAHTYLDVGRPFFSGKDCAELADLIQALAHAVVMVGNMDTKEDKAKWWSDFDSTWKTAGALLNTKP